MEKIKIDDNELASIHAYLCGDGYVIKNPDTQKHKYYVIALRNTCKELLQDFQTKFKRQFGLEPKISKNFDRCKIDSKELYYLLVNSFGPFYSRKWTVPKMSKEHFSEWLKSFADCDGTVFSKKGIDRHIALDSVNIKGLKEIKRLLKKHFKITCLIRKRSNRDLATLIIYGKNYLIKYKKNIDFNHPKKQKKLEEAINSYAVYPWNFPKDQEELKEFIKTKLKEKIKIESNDRIHICSKIQKNLKLLSHYLKKFYSIYSIVSKSQYSGYGTLYFQLSINYKKDVKKAKELFT